MKNITLKYYDIESGEQIISSEQIKSVKVIDEIDVTHMSNPTPVVDIVLKCTQDDDLEFDIDAQCDVCSGDTVLFEMYVSNSMRGSEYEWKLSLH